MFERFTERARRVMVLAQEEARLLECNFIGTEHLLLGLIHEGEGVAALALGELGVTLDAVRIRVAETLAPSSGEVGESVPFTPDAKRVLERSLREALQLQHNYIGTEHILLGIAREPDTAGARVLAEVTGADLVAIRAKVLGILGGVGEAGVREGRAFAVPSLPSLRPLRARMTRSPGAPDSARCAHCGAALAEHVGYQHLRARPGAGEDDGDQLPMLVLFCDQCGAPVGIFLDPTTPGPAPA